MKLELETQDAKNGIEDTLSVHSLGKHLEFYLTSKQYKDNYICAEDTSSIIITAKQVSELISFLILVQREQRKGMRNE